MPKPRNLYRTLQMKQARRKVQDLLQRTALRQLTRLQRQVRAHVRRLRKDDDWEDMWDDFEAEWDKAFTYAYGQAFNIYGEVERDWYKQNGVDVSYDSQEVVRQYKAGTKITRTPKDIKEEVGKTITDWFNGDAPIDDLIDQLAGQFGESRARLIAINETTTIGSVMTLDIMRSAGIEKWTWETRKDDIVCPMCGELDGQVFTSRDDMPPDGSHIGCRCGAAPVLPTMEEDWEW